MNASMKPPSPVAGQNPMQDRIAALQGSPAGQALKPVFDQVNNAYAPVRQALAPVTQAIAQRMQMPQIPEQPPVSNPVAQTQAPGMQAPQRYPGLGGIRFPWSQGFGFR